MRSSAARTAVDTKTTRSDCSLVELIAAGRQVRLPVCQLDLALVFGEVVVADGSQIVSTAVREARGTASAGLPTTGASRQRKAHQDRDHKTAFGHDKISGQELLNHIQGVKASMKVADSSASSPVDSTSASMPMAA